MTELDHRVLWAAILITHQASRAKSLECTQTRFSLEYKGSRVPTVREKSGNSVSGQEMLNSISKSVKSEGILFWANHQVWERVSLLVRVMLF